MLVVLASRYDQYAERLASRWGEKARVLTPDDLSIKGWRFHLNGREHSSAVVGGKLVDCNEIDGVLTRLPRVFDEDLSKISPTDRVYVAAEMTAFLAAWLSNLECPVLNRPTPLCLSGPFLRREMWVHTAANLGVPILPVTRNTSISTVTDVSSQGLNLVAVNVVGDACIGNVDGRVAEHARRLAREVGVDLLCARFTNSSGGSLFVDADYWLDLSNPHVSDAILGCLR